VSLYEFKALKERILLAQEEAKPSRNRYPTASFQKNHPTSHDLIHGAILPNKPAYRMNTKRTMEIHDKQRS